jgi:large subunit ribosomal protein L22
MTKNNLIDYKKDFVSKAILINSKVSPRKISLVLDEIRNKTPLEAKKILSFCKKKSGLILLKLLESAISNAVHNINYDKDKILNLVIHTWAGKGMMIKRMEPRARGSGNTRLKRFSNVYMYLKEKSLMTEVTSKKNRKLGENK